jgi:hypothetical protein
MNAQYPNGAGAPGVAENAGDWAYQSLPQDVTLPAPYKFDFGPLAADFNWPNSPGGVSIDSPPEFSATITPAPGLASSIVTINGQRYFEMYFQIKNISVSCTGLTLWIY